MTTVSMLSRGSSYLARRRGRDILPLLVALIVMSQASASSFEMRRHLAFLPSKAVHRRDFLSLLSFRGGGDAVLEAEEETSADEDSQALLALAESSDDEDEVDIVGAEECSDSGDESTGIEYEEEAEEDSDEEDSAHVASEVMPAVVETTVLEHVDTADSEEEEDESEIVEESEDEQNSEDESSEEEAEVATVTAEIQETFTPEEVEAAIGIASGIRGEGKKLHDDGEYTEAASRFSSAANLLLPVLGAANTEEGVADDFATCRLHEALCLLKAEDYEEAMRACTDVLEGPSMSNSESFHVAPALRARAFHRRAKAQMELGDEAAALQDAREAAFLGDQKAVALYGKLMRENSGTSWPGDLGGSPAGGGFGDLGASSALFESLLSKSSGPSSSGMDSSPMGDMGGMSSLLSSMMGTGAPSLGGGLSNGSDGGEGVGGLAKSVLSSLSKRLEDEATQDQICNFLQGTSGPQLRQMAGLAGLQVEESQANRLAAFCQGVTPKLIRRTLRITKTGYYSFQLLRKVVQFISKYRSIIILLLLVGWTKSALLRPIPVNRRAARLAAEAAKTAALEAEKITAKVTDVVAAM